ncbi:MAG TPA: ribonuclease P protein component [Terriglobales bacterium]|nr:ribonuclease P protein component [Terriglobales bacterium]
MPSPPDTAIKRGGEAWPQRRRLLSRAQFRAIYEQGMRRSSPHFTAFGLPGPAGGGAVRFGITASRKLGGAVVRNRLRRRTRELLRRQAAADGLACDIVINPRPAVATAPLAALAAELDELVGRLRAAVAKAQAAPGGGR